VGQLRIWDLRRRFLTAEPRRAKREKDKGERSKDKGTALRRQLTKLIKFFEMIG